MSRTSPTILLLIALALSLAQVSFVQAQQTYKPKVEAGLAGAGIYSAAYPGSSVSSDRFFAAPWLIYRGENLNVKDGGVNLTAYDSDRVTVDLGASFSLNADSSITPLRDGMPDLDYLVELGPRMNVWLYDEYSESGYRNRLNWKTSYRQAMSLDFRRVALHGRGPVFDSELDYRWDSNAANGFSIEASVGALWAGNKISDYIYAVEPQYVTEERQAYDARPGFLGIDLSLGFQLRPVKKMNVYLGLGVDLYNGSRNDQSPLFEEELGSSVILGVAYTLYESTATVLVRDE